jgi:hypothetical protein
MSAEHDEAFEFTVESYNTDPMAREQQSDHQKVFAASPEAAALMLLTEELFPIGNVQRLRARVSRIAADGSILEMVLYKKL